VRFRLPSKRMKTKIYKNLIILLISIGMKFSSYIFILNKTLENTARVCFSLTVNVGYNTDGVHRHLGK
jgi:hypothetical protein